MPKPGHTGITRIIKAYGFSMLGFKAAWKHESAFRQEVVLGLLILPLAFLLGETGTQVVLLVTSLLLVIIVELLNSAVEAVVDRIGDEPHKLSGRAKDMGSAAVFISLVLVFVVWGLIAYENLV